MTVFCSDDFSRPDGPSLGNTYTGQPWVATGWGTVAGRGRKGGSEVNAVVASTGATGVYAATTQTIPAASGDQLCGPLALHTDALNFVLWERVLTATEDAVKLYVRTAGTFVERAVYGGPPGSTGIDPDAVLELAVAVDGAVLSCSVNGTVRATYTLNVSEAAALTGNGAGMRDEGSPGYWVDFVVATVATGPTTEWADKDDARLIWPDAVDMDDALLDHLLAVSQELCAAYAPALADGAPVPARYKQAVVQQARETWSNAQRDGDVLGFDGDYAIRVRPLADSVKQLLRPNRAVPSFGVAVEEES
ncbi:phage gp6-like head-tail connector protein [Jiangella muralis]|uniref:phage gp6-like head-tail connector protein n=1 Tax=Jiangella muralis TaxID=702383 RepID=UPI00069E2BBD|nr:phage gp6-like head-tail connector protein [Jiangella muralis]